MSFDVIDAVADNIATSGLFYWSNIIIKQPKILTPYGMIDTLEILGLSAPLPPLIRYNPNAPVFIPTPPPLPSEAYPPLRGVIFFFVKIDFVILYFYYILYNKKYIIK